MLVLISCMTQNISKILLINTLRKYTGEYTDNSNTNTINTKITTDNEQNRTEYKYTAAK